MADAGKATVKEVKDYFAEGESGRAVTASELIALKKEDGVTHATAYDDLAFGLGDGSYTY